MTVRHAGLLRVGFRRLGEAGSSGLPYVSPLTPNAVVFIDPTGTKATTATTLLYEDPGSGSRSFAVLEAGSALDVTDDAHFVVKAASGRPMAWFENGNGNRIVLNGVGAVDAIESRGAGGFQIGGNVAGFNNAGLTLQPGNPGFSFATLTADQIAINCATKLGFFTTTPVVQRTKTTPGPAGGAYNATAQAMLNDCFNALRAYGLLV